MKRFLFSISLLLLLFSCKQKANKINSAFYYWKTVYDLDSTDVKNLKNNHFNILYLRLFDVDWDGVKNTPMPKATLQFNSDPDTGLQIVPVIYITQTCLKKLSLDSVKILGGLIAQKANAICKVFHINYNQIQIDADWTESTKDKYFALLTEVKKAQEGKRILSCTIRLHQIKFPEKTGVPPIDRGMLMFYNMGELSQINEENSIYNEKTATQYTDHIDRYKLPLDMALPHFSWGILYRGKKVAAILNGLKKENLDNPFFMKQENNWYTVKASTTWGSNDLHAGDRIRLETADENTCKDAWAFLKLHQKSDSFTLTFFDLKPKTNEKTFQDLYHIAHSSD
ncbi:MAG: hypothetical protein SGJ10_05470 [Bacteroidota bacterium]|nr:hypothetical protein [Bacteroidota bacterium]